MNQLPENSLRIYDVTLVTSYLIGLVTVAPFFFRMSPTGPTSAWCDFTSTPVFPKHV